MDPRLGNGAAVRKRGRRPETGPPSGNGPAVRSSAGAAAGAGPGRPGPASDGKGVRPVDDTDAGRSSLRRNPRRPSERERRGTAVSRLWMRLLLALVLVAGLAVAPPVGYAQEDTIKIGFLSAFTGVFSSFG